MKTKLLLIALLSVLIFSGCVSQRKEDILQKSFPCTAAGVLIEEAPEKVAVLSLELENVLRAFSLEGKIAAVSDLSSTECEYKAGNIYEPNVESIINSGSQYVLTTLEMRNDILENLLENGVKVLVLSPPKNSSDLMKIYDTVSLMFFGSIDAPLKSETAFAPYKAALDELKTAAGGATFLYFSSRELSQPVNSFSFGILSEVFTASSQNSKLTEEELVALNPTYIFLDENCSEEYIRSLSSAENLSAVLENNIISLPSDFFDTLMPEMVTATRLLLFP